jgi:hypothetical protein
VSSSLAEATEGDAILNIPLRCGGGEDFWEWSLEKTGVYSVKFAYHALVNHNKHLALDEETITKTSTGILFGSSMLCPRYGYFGGESYVVFYQLKVH